MNVMNFHRMKVIFLTILALWVTSGEAFPRFDADRQHIKEYDEKIYSTDMLDDNPEQDSKYWYKKATEELLRRRNLASDTVAKNIILFMGDGMSVPTITAARLFKAERNKQKLSQAEPLSFEKFLFSGFSRTYCVDYQVADSACSATAYLGGSKANMGTIGVSGRVRLGDYKGSNDKANHVNSIAYLAQLAGKATGFVTTTRVTHASPAGTFAHIADRDWECDADMKSLNINTTEYYDIAKQLVLSEPGKNFNVILGGGRGKFFPKTVNDPDGKKKGQRLDNLNLVQKWLDDKKNKQVRKYRYVTNREQLLNINETQCYLLGLFGHGHMNYKVENNKEQPTLEEMTEAALKVLQKKGKQAGYFLFVEGGRIDQAHHDNLAHMSLDETIEFSKAIAKAVNMTNEEDTLIVVTADHAHTMSFSGYPTRDKSIFGFAGVANDKWVYTTLSYANGPGYSVRKDLQKEPTGKADYVFPATVPLESETHGGDDVAVFARGPNAQLFGGSYEQSYIPHAMAFAAKIRPLNP